MRILMLLEFFILAAVFILKGIATLGTTPSKVATVLAWPIGVFLVFSIWMDLFQNIPRTLKTPEPIVSGQFKAGYLRKMIFSLLLRSISIILIGIWFIFVTGRFKTSHSRSVQNRPLLPLIITSWKPFCKLDL